MHPPALLDRLKLGVHLGDLGQGAGREQAVPDREVVLGNHGEPGRAEQLRQNRDRRRGSDHAW